MTMTIKARRKKMVEMRDYRSRKMLAELKLVLFTLKNKKIDKEITLSEDAEKVLNHGLKIVEQV